jgi:GH18 family chitinase
MRRASLVAAMLLVASCHTDAPTPGGDAPAAKSRTAAPVSASHSMGMWVSAYYAGWYWEWYPPSAVDMTAMTHFIFGRYAPGGGTLGGRPGEVIPGAGTGHGAQVEGALIAKAHAHKVKALMMLGGAGDGPGFDASTADAGVRATFVGRLLDQLVANNYDGVDVDWEDRLDTARQRGQLIAFLGELRAAAAERRRYQPPEAPFIITFPGYAVNVNTDLPIEAWKVEVAALADQYNLMTYGQNFAAFGWQTWLFGALKDAAPGHPTSIESSVQAYVDAGVPRGKLGMGLGFYGNYYFPPITGPRQANPSNGDGGDDNRDNYRNFHMQGLLDHPDGTYVWDEAAQTGYYRYAPAASYRTESSAPAVSISMLTTEDPRSIAAKGAWARAGGCGGTIVWTINYGYVDAKVGNPPLEAVKEAFRAE